MSYKISLKNNKSFYCSSDETIFSAAKNSDIYLDHSCLSARCRSCIVKVLSGEIENVEDELVLSTYEKSNNYILSCNAKPKSDIELDLEDLTDFNFFEKQTLPAKISLLEKQTDSILKVVLRLPPNSNFCYNSGQYVNLIKGNIKRSYSIANKFDNNNHLEFFIKKYENGLMSKYLFEEAKVNDLLLLEGPFGTFFLRNPVLKNIIFLATGTGIAPIKAILENIFDDFKTFSDKKIWLFFGTKYKKDLFWLPNFDSNKLNIRFTTVFSRENKNLYKKREYIQDIVLNKNIDLKNSQIYACGSNEMINSARKLFLKNRLIESNFYSDAFVQTN